MKLRTRLTLALTALAAVGLLIFGFATYTLYARSQYDRLDDQLRASVQPVTVSLLEQLGGGGGGGATGDDDELDEGDPTLPGTNQQPGGANRPQPQVVAPTGTYGELRDADGTVLAQVQLSEDDAQPDLPDELEIDLAGGEPVLFEVGSEEGSTRWRVFSGPVEGSGGRISLVAVPMEEVSESLGRLLLIELVAGATLLALLAAGSWLILRRGLHPLERMATTARSIRAGDLSQRVAPADDRSEVGELGLALNTMLEDLELSFAEREATERRLRQFLADASHELRTPLTSIQGFAELFRLGQDRPETAQEIDLPIILRRIEEESDRMKGLVEDLLMLARLDETRTVELAPVDLAVLAADACSDAVAAAPDRKVSLDAPEPVVVHGDRDQLRQAVTNLVANARTHTPAGTPIEVGTRREGTQAVLTVRDHGAGIAAEERERVFDRFWRADEARSGTGSGLGLSIVAAICAAHGGEASVENLPEADGGGARFTLRFPV